MTVKMRMVHKYNNHGNRVKMAERIAAVLSGLPTFRLKRLLMSGPIRLAPSGMARLSASLTDPR